MEVVQLNEQTPKVKQNPMSELKEKQKIKVVALYEQTRKQFEPDSNPRNGLFFAPKSQKITLKLDKIKSKSRRRHRKYIANQWRMVKAFADLDDRGGSKIWGNLLT